MINSELMKMKSRFSDLADHCMHLMLSQSRDCIYIYEISSRQMIWLGGRGKLFADGDVAKDAPACLSERGYVHMESKADFSDMFDRIGKGAASVSGAVRLRPVMEQDYRWVNISHTAFNGSGETAAYSIVVFSDVTAKLTAEKQYFYEEQLRAMLSEDVIAVSKVNLTKDQVEYLWGANVDTALLQTVQTYEQMYQIGFGSIHDESDLVRYEQTFGYAALLQAAEKGKSRIAMEYRYKEKSGGEVLWALMNATLTRDAQSGDLYYYSFIRDIDDKKKTELMLRKKAERDSLTGLYNKETAELMIREGLARNREHGGLCALMVMDIDNFKDINDTYGHPYGDYVLSQVGSVLANVFESSSMAGRFGGDEFIVFAAGISSMEWAFQKVRQMQAVLRQAFSAPDSAIKLSFSVGITFSAGVCSFEELYEQADRALYEAKQNGKDRYVVFQRQMRKPMPSAAKEAVIREKCISEVCIMEELEELAIVADAERYQILYANSAARKALKLSEVSSGSRKCYDLIYGFSEPCSFCQKEDLCGEPFNIWINEISNLKKSFMIKEKLIMWGKRKAHLEIFFDVEQLGRHGCHIVKKLEETRDGACGL